MLYHAREPHYRGDAAGYSVERLDRFHGDDPASSDDPLLRIAYAISERVITFLGPTFWILLAYLFLVDEFGH
jgi:hypothetical protein